MKDFQKILDSIARTHRITPEEVLRDMQAALDDAYILSDRGPAPSPEEFVFQAARLLSQQSPGPWEPAHDQPAQSLH